jgi:RHS repeat-associated protein
LTYDAENRQATAGANSYSYDSAGQRVGKTTASGTTTYVYDAFGQLTAEYGTAAATSPCTTCYLSYDHLGSLRMVTDGGANVMARHDYAPFGQEIPAGVDGRTSLWGASDNLSQKFTGQVRDSETNLDFFQARYLSSGLGRFISPDPANAGADITNPQSWNAYAYVFGNPLAMVDPSGMIGKDPDDWDGGCFEAGNPSPCYYPVDGGWGGGWGGGSNSGYGSIGSPSGPGPVSAGSAPGGSGGAGSASTGGSGGPAPSGGGEGPLPPGSFPGGETLGLPPGLTLPGPFGFGLGNPLIFSFCPPSDPDCGAVGVALFTPQDFVNWLPIGRFFSTPPRKFVSKALTAYCKGSPSTRVLTSVRNGAAIGAAKGAFTGFVSGEIFGGEVTLGTSGVLGAAIGASIQGTVGATTGVIKGVASAGACQAAGAYPPGN